MITHTALVTCNFPIKTLVAWRWPTMKVIVVTLKHNNIPVIVNVNTACTPAAMVLLPYLLYVEQ